MTSADTTSVTTADSPEPVLVTASFSFPPRSSSQQTQLPTTTVDMSELPDGLPSTAAVVSKPTNEPYTTGYRIATPLSPADKDANLFHLALPSNGYFYPPGTKVFGRLVRGKQQAKFTRAAAENSLALTVEAVNSCLEGLNAADLTVLDFFYVMYWLRTLSYTKSQFTHISICTDPKHLQRVAKKELRPESLKTVTIVNNTTLEEDLFDPAALDALDLDLVTAAGITLKPPLVSDTLELADAYDARNPEDADAIELVDSYASCIDTVHGQRLSLKDRVAVVEELDPDVLGQIRAYAGAVTRYGIRELIRVRCKECGAEHQAELAVSAHSFF